MITINIVGVTFLNNSAGGHWQRLECWSCSQASASCQLSDMQPFPGIALFIYLHLVLAHGGHDGPASGETVQEYAQKHMASEHHIDSFDVDSFFQLHDLNRDKFWDREEIEAIYGVHHVYSQKKSKDEVEHQKKADHIVNTVLKLLDKDKDGKISMEEFAAVGLDGLPNFDDLGAEGHHYDVESEFFLHHEGSPLRYALLLSLTIFPEEFHSSPETQTDESYTHPEDIEHFAHHEQIEHQEAEREAKFQGISVEEALAQHEPHDEPAADNQPEPEVDTPPPASGGIPKIKRPVPPEAQDPAQRFADAKSDGEWGAGTGGYKPPKSPSDRLRKNLPYKDRIQYKFRRTWGDF
ncbi:hypothetical protein A0H81_01274 [Grifola frondosa]|uniref:EF-hand domain-containing protein n=1 Tax=Grifola frondosa TaxID=5627 RepID=A0A1C7MP82_GRIFR|nr:hypothetical protein A0H81_01274 [Grifola frondosa]